MSSESDPLQKTVEWIARCGYRNVAIVAMDRECRDAAEQLADMVGQLPEHVRAKTKPCVDQVGPLYDLIVRLAWYGVLKRELWLGPRPVLTVQIPRDFICDRDRDALK